MASEFPEASFTFQQVADYFDRPEAIVCLRPDVIERSISRLVRQRVLESVDELTETFELSDRCVKDLRQSSDGISATLKKSTANLFGKPISGEAQKITQRLLLHTLAILMARFGSVYASQLVGHRLVEKHPSREKLLEVCRESLAKFGDASIDPEDLASAVRRLFEERDPNFSSLVFSFVQFYYLARLLGMDLPVDYLSEDAFKECELILDTNVVVPALLEESRHHRSLLELKSVCDSLGISLTVTESSLDELQRVVEYQKTTLAQTYDAIPEEMESEIRSVFFQTYRSRKRQNPNLTVDGFFESVDHAREVMESKWGAKIYDMASEGNWDESNRSLIIEALRSASFRVRHLSKTEGSLDHDAHLYYLVRYSRGGNGDGERVWVLTLDTSLPEAARILAEEDEIPYCLTLDGFLQTISPFIRSEILRRSFEDLFVDLVVDKLLPTSMVFALDDFRIFTDFDLSIKRIPPDDIRRAITHVRKTVLRGSGITEENKKEIALELHKLFVDPDSRFGRLVEQEVQARDEIIGKLEDKIKESEATLKSDRRRHAIKIEKSEARTERKLAALERKLSRESMTMSDKICELEATTEEKDAMLTDLREHLDSETFEADLWKRRSRLLSIFLVGILASVVVWLWGPLFGASVLEHFKHPFLVKTILQTTVALVCIETFRTKGTLMIISTVVTAILGLLLSLATLLI